MKQKYSIFLRAAAVLLAVLCLAVPALAGGLPDAAVETGPVVEQTGEQTRTAAEGPDGAGEVPADGELPAAGADSAPVIRADEAYVFTGAEFSADGELRGVFLTAVPAGARLSLGSRTLRSGDAVPASDFARLRLRAAKDEDAEATLCFLPIREGGADPEAVFTLHVESTRDEPPVAKDGSLETYRNLPNTGRLRAANDDDGGLTFTLVQPPKRGSVELAPDGRFVYTPEKNKVGEDCFTFTAADEAGNVSNEAKIEIRILRPQDETTFSDLPAEDQFTARWLRQTGLFSGERTGALLRFGPEQPVTRGEFLCMALRLAGVDPEVGLRSSGFADEDEAPAWMRPYLASAMRRGIVTEDGAGSLRFRPNDPVTAAEAAVMVARALELDEAVPVSALNDPAVPARARGAVAAVLRRCRQDASGFSCALPAFDAPLTRRQAADLLYAAANP